MKPDPRQSVWDTHRGFSTGVMMTRIQGAMDLVNAILPPTVDNSYRGRRSGLWLLGLVAAVKMLQSLEVIFNGYSTAIAADGIAVNTYPRDAAQAVLALFALGSLWRLTFSASCMVVLTKYRALVPAMLLLLSLVYVASELLFLFIPLPRVGSPAGPTVNLALFILTGVGLVQSLRVDRRIGS